jgi:hypothetical protein
VTSGGFRLDPVRVETALGREWPDEPFPRASNRARWASLTTSQPARAQRLIERAEKVVSLRPTNRAASLFIRAYSDLGTTEDAFDAELNDARKRLSVLALAECLEYKGRFLDAIVDTAWSICEESSWAHPFILGGLPDVDEPVVDLRVAMTCLELAELSYLLHESLHPAVLRRIWREVAWRGFEPVIRSHDLRWLRQLRPDFAGEPAYNWIAVCAGSLVAAALYSDLGEADLAEFVSRCLIWLDDYLDGFDVDGGTTEGIAYWNYGFGYFAVAAHLLECRSGGAIRLLDDPRARKAARFPLRMVLSPPRFVSFSDSDASFSPTAPLLAYLGRRLALPDLVKLAGSQSDESRSQHLRLQEALTWGVRSLWWTTERSDPPRPARHDFFRGMQWMIARSNPGEPTALVVAIKGGHNREMHNHNDVGSLIVHVCGESLIIDPGRGRYTRSYFGERRYDQFVCSSLGHSVPVVNGLPQHAGQSHRAELLEHSRTPGADVLVLDLLEAFPPDSDLVRLRRSVRLLRVDPLGEVVLTDDAAFAERPGTLESILITRAEVTTGAGFIVLAGGHAAVRIEFESREVAFRHELAPAVDLADGKTDLTRLIFGWHRPRRTGEISLRLVPIQPPA